MGNFQLQSVSNMTPTLNLHKNSASGQLPDCRAPRLLRYAAHAVLTAEVPLGSIESAFANPCSIYFNQNSQSEVSAARFFPTLAELDLSSTCANALFGGPNESTNFEALAQLTPYQALAQSTLAISVANQQFRNVKNRLMLLRHSDWGGFIVSGVSGPNLLASAGLPGQSSGGAGGDKDSSLDRLGVFMNGNFDAGDKDATKRELGFEYDWSTGSSTMIPRRTSLPSSATTRTATMRTWAPACRRRSRTGSLRSCFTKRWWDAKTCPSTRLISACAANFRTGRCVS
ncbi:MULTISPECIES: hypothetical protein [Methylomicrobium]